MGREAQDGEFLWRPTRLFALGALSLLGKRVPYNLKIFLATVAVVDDVIAIGVANMAVRLQLNALNPVAWKVGGGIFLGLFLGKPIGFCVSGLVMKKLGLAEMPASLTMGRLVGLGFMAGIGFTVSLFMTSLSFNDPGLIDSSKLFILVGSCLSAVVGLSLLAWTSQQAEAAPRET